MGLQFEQNLNIPVNLLLFLKSLLKSTLACIV